MYYMYIIYVKYQIVNYKHLYDNATSNWLSYHTDGVLLMIADRIKYLREKNNKTQSALAKQLGITRASVNAWEMGISVPSTQYIVELSRIFDVSTDYLLGVEKSATMDISGLSEQDVQLLYQSISHLKQKHIS